MSVATDSGYISIEQGCSVKGVYYLNTQRALAVRQASRVVLDLQVDGFAVEMYATHCQRGVLNPFVRLDVDNVARSVRAFIEHVTGDMSA